MDFFCFKCFLVCGWQSQKYLYERGNRNWSRWRNKIVYTLEHWNIGTFGFDRMVENIIKKKKQQPYIVGKCKRKRNNNLLHLIMEKRMQGFFFHNDYTFHNFLRKYKTYGLFIAEGRICLVTKQYKNEEEEERKKNHTWAITMEYLVSHWDERRYILFQTFEKCHKIIHTMNEFSSILNISLFGRAQNCHIKS